MKEWRRKKQRGEGQSDRDFSKLRDWDDGGSDKEVREYRIKMVGDFIKKSKFCLRHRNMTRVFLRKYALPFFLTFCPLGYNQEAVMIEPPLSLLYFVSGT